MANKDQFKRRTEGAFRSAIGRVLGRLSSIRRRQSCDAALESGAELLDDARWRLTESKERLRELLDCQDALIAMRDAAGRITFANQTFCEAFGVELSEVKGKYFAPEPLRTEEGALLGEGGGSRIELFATHRGRRWVLWETHALFGSESARETIWIGRDVTAERSVAREMRAAREQAEAGSRAKSRFLAAMSHEIRTPMNGILGMASLMSETPLSVDQRTYLKAIDQSARALLSIINEILDFSKIEAGKLQLVEAPFSVRAALKSAVDLVAIKAAEKRNSVSLTIADEVPDILIGDQARFGQIILNLVSNAVKFTEGGAIDVSVRRLDAPLTVDGKTAFEFEVRDTGIGFSPATMKLLFDEFEQAESMVGQHQGGTGLGLAISKRLAKAMDGDIVAEGAVGKGATFRATLRFRELGAEVSPSPIAQEAESGDLFSPPPSCAGARILVAEDNDVNALLARRVCEGAGATVVAAKNGREALDIVEHDFNAGGAGFDVILMDVFMPDMDGLEACRAVKELYRRRGERAPPIVALTAHAFAEDRLRCLAAGMDDYLAKPFDMRQLQSIIGKWVSPHGCRRAG